MRSKSLLLLSSILGVALAATNALASLTAYEPFNYTLGAGTFANNTVSTATAATPTQTTGGGFTGNWTCGASGSIVAGLTYTGLPVANNALSSTSQQQFVSFATSLARSGTQYISFLFKTTSGNPGGNI